jgi:transposase
MPWKECSVMDERLRFVARLLDGEAMSEVCRAFGISRKTGYKIFERYKEHGLEALTDRSRRPVRYANQLPRQIESLIVAAKRDKPHWGARKIRELLVRRLDDDIRVPAKGERPRWVGPVFRENRRSFKAVAEAFLAAHLGGRCEPVGDDFENSTIEFKVGRELVPGLD